MSKGGPGGLGGTSLGAAPLSHVRLGEVALRAAPHAALGATVVNTGQAQGVAFALWAPRAERVQLCLFDSTGQHELSRLDMHGPSAVGWQGVWHGHVAGAAAGQVYGWRVSGPWSPREGQRFNAAKLLLDPYAQEVVGRYAGQSSFVAYDAADAQRASNVDNAADALKARVVAPWPALPRIKRRVPDDEVVLYEAHVKSATALHPGVPQPLRGTYAGLAHPAFLEHLKQLGVTTVSLLPLQQRADEARLLKLGLTNHWGYNTVAFFAAEPRYAQAGPDAPSPMAQFRAMVQALHDAGIEVVLDVVYNHTAETDEFGPTFHFRGIDDGAYYHQREVSRDHQREVPRDHQREVSAEDLRAARPDAGSPYENWTGCGNALNLTQPRVVQLVLDSLRFWATAGGVDGFRFDLAPVLARGAQGYSQAAGFFAAIQADPLLRTLRLIAEPWDIGPGGYQLGGFPAPWCEWNDRYRDTMRAFWLTAGASRGDFAHALAGSSRAFRTPGRSALASVNFITAHDGFTLHDLVSYQHRHNEANGEDNRDGHGHNHSVNAGVEGTSDNAQVLALRGRLQRALLATLLVSQGTPMLLSGDEIGHSQQGNNNAYCQDNSLTWLDWAHADTTLLRFVQRALALRRELPALRSAVWHEGAGGGAQAEADLAWFTAQGLPLTEHEWRETGALQVRFGGTANNGDANGDVGVKAAAQVAVLLLVNPLPHEVTIQTVGAWQGRLRSDAPDAWPTPTALGQQVTLPAQSLWVASATA